MELKTQEVIELENEVKKHKQLYEQCSNKNESDQLIQDYISELQSKNRELEEKLQSKLEKKHNERGAGRKPKLNNDLIKEIHKLKNEKLTISQIAQKLKISAGLTHKGIHSKI